MAHVEPKEEPAGWALVAKASSQKRVTDVEFDAVGVANDRDVLLLRPDGRGGMLHNAWHLRRRQVADFRQRLQEVAITGSEARAHAGQVRALGQRSENKQIFVKIRRGR